MEWPSSNPDLNPIENLWSFVKNKLYEGGNNITAKQTYRKQMKSLYQKLNQWK